MNISKAAKNKSKCKKSLDFKNEYNNKIDTWRADKKALQTCGLQGYFLCEFTQKTTLTKLKYFTNKPKTTT